PGVALGGVGRGRGRDGRVMPRPRAVLTCAAPSTTLLAVEHGVAVVIAAMTTATPCSARGGVGATRPKRRGRHGETSRSHDGGAPGPGPGAPHPSRPPRSPCATAAEEATVPDHRPLF